MYLSIKNVKPQDNYRLLLTFENGEQKVFDLSPFLNIGKFAELKDMALFNSVKICFDSIQWANKLDLDPEFLYTKGKLVDN